MASSATQLDRIADLVDKLGPVSNKQRGMRIEAQEWNTLVDVLLGVLQLDRLQEQRTETLLDQRFAAKDHEHLGQVSLAWLDADLQARLGGAENSISTRQTLAEMSQKIQALSDQVSKLSTALDNSQRVLDDTIVSNTDKTRKLLDFERRFSGVEDLRTTVSTLANNVVATKTNVDKVLELRNSLQDAAGNPINVVQLKQDLTDIQSLRENLKGADGQLLRLRDIEVKLNEVADVVGTGGQGGLEGRFATLSASLQESLIKGLDDKLTITKAALQAENAASETRLRGEIRTSSAQDRDALTQQIAGQIGDAKGTFNNTLDSRLSELDVRVTKNVDDSRVLFNQRLAEVPDQVQTLLAPAVSALENRLSVSLQSSLGDTLKAQITDVDTRLTRTLGDFQASTNSRIDTIPGVVTGQLNLVLPDLQAGLKQQITSEIGTARSAIESGVDTRVSAAVSSQLQNLDARISISVKEQSAALDGKVSDAVIAATRNVPSQVADEVQLQLSAANLDNKIQDSARAMTTQLRSELKSGLADQDARTSGSIQSAVTLLQGQLSASVAATLRDANEFTVSQNKNLRTEMTTLIDTRVRTNNVLLLTDVDTRLTATRDAITTDVGNRLNTEIGTVRDAFSTRLTKLETKIKLIP